MLQNIKKYASVGFVAAASAVSGIASAAPASVLDAAAKTAIQDGFGNMQATALDVLSTSWPFLLAVTAIMFAPKIVRRLSHMV